MKRSFPLFVLAVAILIAADPIALKGQPFGVPFGPAVTSTGSILVPDYSTGSIAVVKATSNEIYISPGYDGADVQVMGDFGENIAGIEPKLNDPTALIVTFVSGNQGVLSFRHWPPVFSWKKPMHSALTSETWEEGIGDAIYALSTAHVYVTRDSGTTYQIDSAGLSGAHVSSIAIDSSQTVYAATNKGLFTQAPDSSVWHRVAALDTLSLLSVFVDRMHRIFVGLNGNPVGRVSTDLGVSWSLIDTSGLENSNSTIKGDDALGNVYAIGNGGAFRSPDGVTPWTRIDGGILAITGSEPYFYSLCGDSTIYASTTFGAFASTDQGSTWSDASADIPATNFYGFYRSKDGSHVMSTSRGIFSSAPGDTAWTKLYPQVGYQTGLPIHHDSTGDLFTVLPNPDPNSRAMGTVMKSTDAGASWIPDTTGISQTYGNLYLVDYLGNQHCASSLYGSSFQSYVMRNNADSGWVMDTVGFPVHNNSYTTAMVGDGHQTLYISGYYNNGGTRLPGVYRRPLSGGAWVTDTAGIPHTIAFFIELVHQHGTDMIGLGGSQIIRRSGGVWQPTSWTGGVSKIACDSSGSIYAVRRSFTPALGAIDVGISVSTDNGATWRILSNDTVNVQLLRAFGDSVYELTARGLSVLTSQGAVSTLSFTASSGWNLVSIPTVVGDFQKTSLFPTAVSNAFSYNGAYTPQTVLQNGIAYWLNFPGTTPVSYGGFTIASETLAVAAGWNMIGTLSSNVPTSSVTASGTATASNYFSYVPGSGYTPSDTLKPGYGYWINTTQSGSLILSGSAAAQKAQPSRTSWDRMDRLTFTDAAGRGQVIYLAEGDPSEGSRFVLPPAPPEGVFDARFASQQMAEFVPPGGTRQLSVFISSARYPVSVHTELHRFDVHITSGEITSALPSGGAAVIAGQPSRLSLAVSSTGNVPVAVRLEQNYPNPFNPSTNIGYDLPSRQPVVLKIYDVIGREIATLADGLEDSGVHVVTWDASRYASGIYYYRLITSGYSDTRKLLLIK